MTLLAYKVREDTGNSLFKTARPDRQNSYSLQSVENYIFENEYSNSFQSFSLKPDGTKLLAMDTTRQMAEFELTTPYDFTTLNEVNSIDMSQFQGSSTDIRSMWVNPSGDRIVVDENVLGNFNRYVPSNPWTVDFSSRDNSTSKPTGQIYTTINFVQNGDRAFFCTTTNTSDYEIIQAEFSNPYDETAISSTNKTGFQLPSSTFSSEPLDDLSISAFIISGDGKLVSMLLRRFVSGGQRTTTQNNFYLSNPYEFSSFSVIEQDKVLPRVDGNLGAYEQIYLTDQRKVVGSGNPGVEPGAEYIL